MIIFNEEEYSKKILYSKKYNTKKNQGRERSALVRYLSSLDYTTEEIKKELYKIPIFGGDYLSTSDIDKIYDKIIAKANDFMFIKDIEVKITQKEMEIILEQEEENDRNLLFVYLVYYKWASKVSHLRFYSKKNDVIMVIENDNDLWKIANLYKLRIKDRFKICSKFISNGLYKQDNFKKYNYFYLPFIDNDSEVVLTISNFDNIVGELYMYLFPSDYIRCKECDVVIKKTTNNKKYCSDCAKEVSNKQKNIYRKNKDLKHE